MLIARLIETYALAFALGYLKTNATWPHNDKLSIVVESQPYSLIISFIIITYASKVEDVVPLSIGPSIVNTVELTLVILPVFNMSRKKPPGFYVWLSVLTDSPVALPVIASIRVPIDSSGQYQGNSNGG